MNFKKANIIIVTLFITLIIWLIWLLITKYVLNSVKLSSQTFKYYKAYYIWYAWVELELLKIKNHWYWFEDKISSTSKTVEKNFTGFKYFFSSKVKSLGKYITNTPLSLIFDNINCSDKKNWIKLATWDAILLPLIYDKNVGEAKISWENYQLLNIDFSDLNLHYNWNFTISIQNGTNIVAKKNVSNNTDDTKSISEILGITSISSSASEKPFLVIWALENWEFCISSRNKIVTPYSYILSQWNYMDQGVLVSVGKKHNWANFSVYSIFWN